MHGAHESLPARPRQISLPATRPSLDARPDQTLLIAKPTPRTPFSHRALEPTCPDADLTHRAIASGLPITNLVWSDVANSPRATLR
jgi:hypothetical protein